ncbi:MAG: hypothetical protein PUJ51_17985 [Clostridiales bacterium]|jgi:hypothetical protein|nr:hypothetical protein [Clostridiales bacterium]
MEKAGQIEYKMSKRQATELIKSYKGPRKNPQDILIEYVNTNLNLLRKCVKVIVD